MIGIVVNPVSGGGQGRALVQKAEALFQAAGMETAVFESSESGGFGRTVRLALSNGCDGIACIGGDGSLSEAMPSLVDSKATLYLVPSGTGNDFARALGLPRDPMAALEAQLSGTPCDVDCGLVNGRAFANVSGSGFDVDVLRRTEELKERYPGAMAYRRAVADVIGHFKPFTPHIVLDGEPLPAGKYSIVEVANGKYFGGGMKVAPDAQWNDGCFDVVLVRAVPRLLIPLLLPLFITGLHVRVHLARVYRARRVSISSRGMTLNIDGQLEAMDQADYEIVPAGLRMRLPCRSVSGRRRENAG